jgi:NAD(P)-dependent dehydrogenase (short-subunit alcohol dehydrogenase family)
VEAHGSRILARRADVRDEDRERIFRDVVDVNLVGVWNTGIKASGTDRPGLQAYSASKRALVALMQGWASHLAPESIRVNTIHPSGVATDMILNETTMALFEAGDPWLLSQQNALPIPLLHMDDVAGAVAWLVSDAAAFITGTEWKLDAGFTLR